MGKPTPQRARGAHHDQLNQNSPDLNAAFDAIKAAANHRELGKLLQQAKEQHAQPTQASDADD